MSEQYRTYLTERYKISIQNAGEGQLHYLEHALGNASNLNYFILNDRTYKETSELIDELLSKDNETLGEEFRQSLIVSKGSITSQNLYTLLVVKQYAFIDARIRETELISSIYKRESQPEKRFFYDLIELRNGSHIPVTMISSFWQKFFFKFAKKKSRDDQFFKCPFCGKGSFYSQFAHNRKKYGKHNGCRNCSSFDIDYHSFSKSATEHLTTYRFFAKRHNTKQKKKRRWLKSGTWIFRVRSYVISNQTKGNVGRKSIEHFISQEE